MFFGKLTRALGGYPLRHRQLRLLYAAVFLSYLGASIIFPLFMLYAQRRGATPVQLGLLAAAFLIAPLLAQLPLGWLVDHWGRVPVLLVGLIGHPFIMIFYVVFNHPAQLIGLRFVEGILVSAFQPAVSAYIADSTPVEHRNEAYGALNATLNAGLFVGPLVGGLIAQPFGFPAAFLSAFAVEVMAVPLVLRHVSEPPRQSSADVAGPTSWKRLLSVPLAAVYFVYLSGGIVIGAMTALWALWIHDLGGSYTFIGLTFTVFALPQVFFGAGSGRLAARTGRALPLLASGLIAGGIYVAYGFVTSLVAIVALGVVEGSVIVFQQPLAQALLADAAPPAARGRAQGLAGVVGAAGAASAAYLSPPLYHMSRPLPFALLGGVTIAGCALAALGAFSYERRREPGVNAAGRVAESTS